MAANQMLMSLTKQYFAELFPIEKLVVLDLETTNSGEGHRIVEIGAVLIEHGNIVRFVSELINPGCSMDTESARVHGITDEMVSDKPGFHDLWPQVASLLCNAVVVAHNAKFDSAVLSSELWRIRQEKIVADWWCTLRLARQLWPRLYRSYKLSALASALGIPVGGQHRALADVETTLQLFH